MTTITKVYKGLTYKVNIDIDEYVESPFDNWDGLGKFNSCSRNVGNFNPHFDSIKANNPWAVLIAVYQHSSYSLSVNELATNRLANAVKIALLEESIGEKSYDRRVKLCAWWNEMNVEEQSEHREHYNIVQSKIAEHQHGNQKTLIDLNKKIEGVLPGYPYNDRFDGCSAGFIWVPCEEEVQLIEGADDPLAKSFALAAEDTKLYSSVLNGEAYVYNLTVYNKGGETIDEEACGGFWGCDHDESGLLEYADNAAESRINNHLDNLKRKRLKHYEHIKRLIRNRVPLIYREAA